MVLYMAFPFKLSIIPVQKEGVQWSVCKFGQILLTSMSNLINTNKNLSLSTMEGIPTCKEKFQNPINFNSNIECMGVVEIAMTWTSLVVHL